MKLVVQIPCFNEEEHLGQTIRDIPRNISGIDQVEILVIDDGSTDRTVDVARESGVDHIVRFNKNKGLAKAFTAGLNASIKLGADIIVNTDGDNQYRGEDIPRLIQPILDGEADVVVGDRQVKNIEHFSSTKKFLQRLGSWVVRTLSGTEVADTTSGFRAYSRDAGLRMNIVSPFTYTLELTIQAGKKHMTIIDVPVQTNTPLRKSRLFTSITEYIKRQAVTIIRMYTMYQPLKVFFYVGTALFFLGALGVSRFLYYFFTGGGGGHIQSLVLSGVLIVLGFMLLMIGLVADVVSFNRQLIEDTLYRVRKMELRLLSEEPKKGDTQEVGEHKDFH
ncbi:MAG: glycosyltransferase family 2 protein [Planctomycetota bacterium]|jgi:glycosyltransferase involved in cell wall biosynthesis